MAKIEPTVSVESHLLSSYAAGKIDGTEVHQRLADLEGAEENFKMSFIKALHRELAFFSEGQTDTIAFQSLLAMCRQQYLNYLALQDERPSDLSFTEFIEVAVRNFKGARKDFEEIIDKDKFFKFVAVIESFIEKDLH